MCCSKLNYINDVIVLLVMMMYEAMTVMLQIMMMVKGMFFMMTVMMVMIYF